MRAAIVVTSLHGGGAERQAALLLRGLAKLMPTRLVSLSRMNDYLDVRDSDDVVLLDKRSALDTPRLCLDVGRHLRDVDIAVCFHWYAHLLVTIGAPHVTRVSRFGNPVDRDIQGPVRRSFARWCQRGAAASVGVSWGVTQDVCETIGSPRIACATIPNAVRSPLVDEKSGPPISERYVICPARLIPQKDHATLFSAFRLVAEKTPHVLVIAGEGPEECKLRELAGYQGLQDRVRFVGFRRDLERWLRFADATVLSSRWEGFGSVLIESMAQGTPVVCTDAPFGPGEILQRLPGGVLVPVGDAEGFASALTRVLCEPSEPTWNREVLAESARRLFSADAMAGAYGDLITALRGPYDVVPAPIDRVQA